MAQGGGWGRGRLEGWALTLSKGTAQARLRGPRRVCLRLSTLRG